MTYGNAEVGTAITALADPTRRRIYEQVRQRPRAVGELAKLVRVSQPAVSQHLAVLRRARLVSARPVGTRRLYEARREGLTELRRYLESMWDDVLTAYASHESSA